MPEFLEDAGFEVDKTAMDAPPPAEPVPEPEPVDATPPPAEAAPEPVAETTPEPTTEPGPDPTGTKVDQGLQAALKAEREKRQEAEKRYHDLASARAPVQQPQPAQQPTVDPAKEKEELERLYFDDPVGFQEKRARQIASTIIAEDRLKISAARMAREQSDYLDVMGRFKQHADANPQYNLWGQLQNHVDPARAAYEYMQQIENPPEPFDAEKERERIREEERERLRSEMATEAAGSKPTTPSGGTGGAAPAVKAARTHDDLLEENDRLVG